MGRYHMIPLKPRRMLIGLSRTDKTVYDLSLSDDSTL